MNKMRNKVLQKAIIIIAGLTFVLGSLWQGG